MLFLLLGGFIAFSVVQWYSFIFSKTLEGQVIEIDRVTQPTVVMGSAAVQATNVLYSFAIAIRTPDGKIYTASSEDRQWAIVQKNMCVDTRFYPYPPWNLDKGGTYFNARMLGLKDCPDHMIKPLEPQGQIGADGERTRAIEKAPEAPPVQGF